jgi:hypothetical protein
VEVPKSKGRRRRTHLWCAESEVEEKGTPSGVSQSIHAAAASALPKAGTKPKGRSD